MKKMIYGIIATVVFSFSSFAINPAFKRVNETKNTNQKKVKICTVTCSKTIHGVTYTTTAGNWFSSCDGASERCKKKLNQLSDW